MIGHDLRVVQERHQVGALTEEDEARYRQLQAELEEVTPILERIGIDQQFLRLE